MAVRRRFLVTGASGFIGRHAVTELLNQGHEVVALTRSGSRVDDRASSLSCDVLAASDLDSLVRTAEADTLLHLAWETRHGYYWNAPENIEWVAASALLIKAFRQSGGQRAVVAGTCAEYAATQDLVCDALSTPIAPEHLYSTAKDSLRRMIESYARTTGLSFAWGRIFHLIGPHESDRRLVPGAIRALKERRAFDVNNPDKRLDVMDARDCGRGFAMVAASEVEGPLNVGSGTLVPIGEIVRQVASMLGRPDLLRFTAASDPQDGLSERCAELSTLRDAVGFSPSYTLRDTLQTAIASS
jgi:nucleoside-diphosphate-sugar epimerase